MNTKMVTIKHPAGWGDDPLTQQLEALYGNALGSFAHLPDHVKALVAIDNVLVRMTGLFPVVAQGRYTDAAKLVGRALGAYRAAAQLALEGRPTECMALVRLTVECAAYALVIGQSDAAWTAWVNRAANPKASRDAFNGATMRAAIRDSPGGEGALSMFNAVYESAIDFGAHPNVRAVRLMTKPAKADAGAFDSTVLIDGTNEATTFALQGVLVAGTAAMLLGDALLGKRFSGGASFTPAIDAATQLVAPLLPDAT
jgi:hypothetical protein